MADEQVFADFFDNELTHFFGHVQRFALESRQHLARIQLAALRQQRRLTEHKVAAVIAPDSTPAPRVT